MVDGLAQNISIVSFENVDDLKLNIQNIDYGDKQFVFKVVVPTFTVLPDFSFFLPNY